MTESIEPHIVDGRVSDAKLDELLALQVETSELDFKRIIDPTDTRGLVELAKDVGAMSVRGGYIVGGVNDEGVATGEMDQCDVAAFDEARLGPRLGKYLPEPIEIRTRVTTQRAHRFVLIYVAPHPQGYAVFHTDGQYRDTTGRDRIVFRHGDAFWRAGTRSERITQRGMEQIIQRRIDAAKHAWINEQQALRKLTDDEIHGGGAAWRPLGAINVDLSPRELQFTGLELIRRSDHIASEHILIDASLRARSSVASGDLSGLVDVVDKITALGAIYLLYRQEASFGSVVRTLASIYSIPLETVDDREYALSVNISSQDLAPRLFLMVVERVFALGGLAVRLTDWDAVRTLAVQMPDKVDDSYTNWLRHGLTTAARANHLNSRLQNGQTTTISLITLAAAVVAREPTLRPDGVNDEMILTSMVQFDLLANLAAIDAARSTDSGVFYTNWARFRQGRVQPIADRIIDDRSARRSIFRGDDAYLARAFADLEKLARAEGFGHDGFHGWGRTPVGRFVEENLSPDVS